MSEINYKTVTINEIFDFTVSTNSGLTKSFVNSHKGNIPVYGASMETEVPSYGYIEDNIDGIKYFEDILTYNKDGASGRLFYRKGRFTISEKVVPLVIFDKYKNSLSCDYLKYTVEYAALKNNTYTFANKATKVKFKNITIEIPIDDNGSFDLEKQKELALKYQELEEKKIVLLNKIEYLKKAKIKVNSDYSGYRYIDFNDLFRLSRGQIISKADINKNKGSYPVYSTQKEIFGFIKTYMQDGQFLLWNTDGLAGYIRKTNGKFSYTNIVGIMKPTDKYNMTTISLDYLKYYLEPIFRENRKGRMGINGKNEYTKLNSTMIKKLNLKIPVPFKKDGSFDLEKQKEIAQKYATIESIKRELYNQVLELTNIVVI
ncbi:MAG: restriction endonuclease subunit S [Lachnospiraceae bacterium]|nr:restriction endonuclease subunit S [Lachnospiraceae bacterium]